MSTTSVTLSRRARLPIFVGLCLIALTIIYPVVYLALAAFRTKADYLTDPFGLPHEWTLQNFIVLWNNARQDGSDAENRRPAAGPHFARSRKNSP